ncbi:MAG: DUF2779 domain-containing protein [Caldithrix sp.]|nr:DUF2779 domain-containing protein [Caldithrix sp.]
MQKNKKKYLTKSRFQIAAECPTKLYYYNHSDQYPSSKEDNAFLQALAEGGFQVGALAKCYYPDGFDITTLDYEESLKQTAELMKREEVVIFEAAIRYENMFIRVDILEKNGRDINLIEVKAKSIDPLNDSFTNNKGYISSGWRSYLYDVAFQTHVMEHALPDYNIKPYLMLADKSQATSVDGLNQHFFLKEDETSGRTFVEIHGEVTPPEVLGNRILKAIPVGLLVEQIRRGEDMAEDHKNDEQRKPFAQRIAQYAAYQAKDEKPPVGIGKKCKDCEYRLPPDGLRKGQKIGYRECWREQLGWDDEDFNKPHIFDIWNFRKTEDYLQQGIYLMEDMNPEETFMQPAKDGQLQFKSEIARRQHLQVRKALQPADQSEEVDSGLFAELAGWKYPLHFIDFETSMMAIPFTKDRRPYEQIAFQFSCHTIDEDGECRHDEWIAREPGTFPNFDFVRALKKVLDPDEGTILRYAAHENTVLRQIHDQLIAARDEDRGQLPGDHAELIRFIDSITESDITGEDGKEHRVYGSCNMVDMCRLVKEYYYHPLMGGSNSIKAVLPAIMQSSDLLKKKYTKPYYSKNYEEGMVWWQADPQTGQPVNPYKLLPPLFDEDGLIRDELVLESGYIREGGAAMVAYAKMQFTEMNDKEREAIINGLLEYCELDTLAMVMIGEYWIEIDKGR